MMENNDAILKSLPARLKDARKAQGLSLDAVANLSGVSRSMVSQIERGESSPTIATLLNLTKALNVDFAGLLDDGPVGDRVDVLKVSDVAKITNMGLGCHISILSRPEDAGQHEVYDISFQDGGSLKSQPHSRGTVEHVTVLEGSVSIVSGSASADLGVGDSARYAADVPHEIAAIGSSARIFLVVKAP